MNSLATAGSDTEQDVIVDSKLLGALEVPTAQVYNFPDELYGFPDADGFVLLSAERDGLFWLQSTDFEALTFLLIDPFHFVEGYSVDLESEDLGDQEIDPSEILVLAMLTLPREEGAPATVNLQGPLVFHLSARLGKQVVIESPYGVRHPVDLSRDSQ